MNNQAAQTMPERALAAWTGKHRTDAENRAFLAGYETCQSDANAAALSQTAGVALTEREREWLEYAADHMDDDSEPEDKTCGAVIRELLSRATAAAPSASGGEYPECSGDPASCPENEGHGCCKPNPKCSCPSGDGSLDWPCKAHPPAGASQSSNPNPVTPGLSSESGASVSERARDELNPPLPRDYHSDGLDRTSAGEPHPHPAATGLKGPDQ